MSDTYRTISKATSEILFKERKSKFYGYAFPITSEDEIKLILEELRKKYPNANHVCYAWQLGTASKKYRTNDDGEPNNSAGMPIYGQIQAFDVTNILIAVVRIFGGVKLGVGGLIQAYRTAAQMTLDASIILEKVEEVKLSLFFEYPVMNNVMRIIKHHELKITEQRMGLSCEMDVTVRKTMVETITVLFKEVQGVKVSPET